MSVPILSIGNNPLRSAVDGAFTVTWLARREALKARREGSPRAEWTEGRYEGMLRALGDLLACTGEPILVPDPSIPDQGTLEKGFTLIPCRETTIRLIMWQAKEQGVYDPELDETN